MLVVLDTNVVYQGLRENKGASFNILKLLETKKIQLAVSYKVFKEYEEVLNRAKTLADIKLTKTDVKDFLTFIAYISIPYETYYLLRQNLKDEDDNIFIELAFFANVDYLITNNTKDFIKNSNLIFDNFKIITPKDFYKIWRKNNEN